MLAIHNAERLLDICESELMNTFGSAFAVELVLKLSLECPELFLTEEEYKHTLED